MSWTQIQLTSNWFSLNTQYKYRFTLIEIVYSKLCWSWPLYWKLAYNDKAEDQTRINFLIVLWHLTCSLYKVTFSILSLRHRLAIKPTTNRFWRWTSRLVRQVPLRDPSTYFCNFSQQLGELFTYFLASVSEAVEQRINLGHTSKMLIKQLVWEGPTTPALKQLQWCTRRSTCGYWTQVIVTSVTVLSSSYHVPGCPPCREAVCRRHSGEKGTPSR